MSTTEKITRVALYVRVSTEEQALHGYSLEAQETALVEYAEEKGYKVVKIYRDEGFSARKPVMKRLVMQELLKDVESGKIDMILFTKLDRWFRSVGDYHTVQAVLDKNKVVWKSILEDYQTETADGRLKVNIMLSVAENEADRTSERIKFVFENKRQKKEACFGGAVMPLGYKKEVIDGVSRLVKDPETAPIVEAFWSNVLKYNSIRKAFIDVNAEFGLSRRYKSWTDMSRQEIYTGTYRGVADFCPAYISREDWEYIQQSHIKIKKTQSGRVYLFTGLIRCPGCGKTLKATFKTNMTKKGPKEYHSYRCNNGRLNMCPYGGTTVSERKIEKYLLQNIKSELEKYITGISLSGGKSKPKRKTQNIDKLQEQLRRLNVIYLAGNISDAEYSSQTDAIKADIEKAKQQHVADKPIDLANLRRFMDSDFAEAYSTLTQEDKRRLWRSIIKEIHVKGNNVDYIVFRS